MTARAGPESARVPQPANDKPAVEAKRFSFWYGQKQALHEIDLVVANKAITALIGPSGCGKSTFLRSINRMNDTVLDVRHEGDILLHGEDVYAEKTDVVELRSRIARGSQLSVQPRR